MNFKLFKDPFLFIFRFFKKPTFNKLSILFFIVILCLGKLMVAPNPFLCSYQNRTYSFVFSNQAPSGSALNQALLHHAYQWKKIDFDWAIWPLWIHDPYATDLNSSWMKPQWNIKSPQFFLGSYDLGRSVLSNIIYGLYKSLWIGFLSVVIGFLIGVPLSCWMSYFHQKGLRISRVSFIWSILLLTLGLYFVQLLLVFPQFCLNVLIICIFLILSTVLFWKKINAFDKSINIWPDRGLFFGIGIFKAMPVMFVLLLLVNWMHKPGVIFIACILGFFISISLARTTRYLSISESSKDWVLALQSLGFSDSRIVFKHILPQISVQLIPVMALYIGQSILAETTLSFLGMGLSVEEISLGNMMNSARNFPSAWWVVLFPGILVFWIIMVFQNIGRQSREKLI